MTDTAMRPKRYTHGGRGVPRIRFKMPSSRANTTPIAMFV